MFAKKLTTAKEWLECDKLLTISFLYNDWNQDKVLERFEKQERGELPRNEEAWGLYVKDKMVASCVTHPNHNHMHLGREIKIIEIHMIGSLPEERGRGYIGELMRAILKDSEASGYEMAMLIPFSCSFYRRYGFELSSNTIQQKVDIEQLKGFQNRLETRMLDSEEEVKIVKSLYDSFIQDQNMAYIKRDHDYRYRGRGEFGEPDFFHEGNRQYTYLFFDEVGNEKGYLTFLYVTGENGPFTGDMHVKEMIYDSPETFHSILGFIGKMGAKCKNVIFHMMEDIDLSVILPEGDRIERNLDSHIMMRALDARDLLFGLGSKSEIQGSFTIRIQDDFLPENTHTYEVNLLGNDTKVDLTEKEADLTVSIQTFTQLIVGRIGIKDALYRNGTILNNNKEEFNRIFVKRNVALL